MKKHKAERRGERTVVSDKSFHSVFKECLSKNVTFEQTFERD